MHELNLKPIQESFEKLLSKNLLKEIEGFIVGENEKLSQKLEEEVWNITDAVSSLNGIKLKSGAILNSLDNDLNSLKFIYNFKTKIIKGKNQPKWIKKIISSLPVDSFDTLLPLILLDNIYIAF